MLRGVMTAIRLRVICCRQAWYNADTVSYKYHLIALRERRLLLYHLSPRGKNR